MKRNKKITKKLSRARTNTISHNYQSPFDGFDIFLNNVSWDCCTVLYSINEKVVACSKFECTQRHTQTQHAHTGTGRPTVKPYYFRLRTICGYSTYSMRSRRRLTHTRTSTSTRIQNSWHLNAIRNWGANRRKNFIECATSNITNIHPFGRSCSTSSTSSTKFSSFPETFDFALHESFESLQNL